MMANKRLSINFEYIGLIIQILSKTYNKCKLTRFSLSIGHYKNLIYKYEPKETWTSQPLFNEIQFLCLSNNKCFLIKNAYDIGPTYQRKYSNIF